MTATTLARKLAFSMALALLLCLLAAAAAATEAPAKRIVLIAGEVHQGSGGHPKGTHEYVKSARLLGHCLETAPGLGKIRAEVHLGGWPEDPEALERADAIVLISDGSDRRLEDHPFLAGDRLAVIERQMRRGCGLAAIHWSTFAPREPAGEKFLEWIGGHFDYESGPPPRGWYSKIRDAEAAVRPASPEHPVCRGVRPFRLREEFYYRMRHREGDARLRPVLLAAIPDEPGEQTVAWAVERADGGRGFGFTGGHYLANWFQDDFRKLVLNAIAWSAGIEVPAGGVESDPGGPARGLILTGHQHPAHDWRATTAALRDALEIDPRLEVEISENIEDLAKKSLRDYQLLVLNYCDWERPGPSAEARERLQAYIEGGGGLAIIHFANGAFKDWPVYRGRICRRFWEDGKSGHDPFGEFEVRITPGRHSIAEGLKSFRTPDELYHGQGGELPIEPFAVARSRDTGRDEPLAWAYDHGDGRVFQTVLGHAAESIRSPGAAALIRRGCTWAAGRPLWSER